MKKIFLTGIAAVITISFAYAQTNTFPSSGNVGIGTTSPQGNLDIYNTANTTITPLLSIRSNFHIVGNYGMIKFGDYTQTTDYQKGAIIYESVAGSARGKFHIALENTDGSSSVTIADAKLTVLSNGSVGIGTTTPDQLLSVNGTIHSREVLVNTTGFPDYVFKPTYHLPTLTEIKSYIDQNHHLPDMPTEAEVVKNGLKVGETEALLTKKVEELTLYLIEQNEKLQKINEEDKNRLQSQQAEIEQLKAAVAGLVKQVGH